MNRIGRRTVMCMLLIAALAFIWNVFTALARFGFRFARYSVIVFSSL